MVQVALTTGISPASLAIGQNCVRGRIEVSEALEARPRDCFIVTAFSIYTGLQKESHPQGALGALHSPMNGFHHFHHVSYGQG
jgi:hypothetical protein